MFAQPAALLLFVAETLGDREPFQRLPERALVRRNDPGERWRQFGPERHFAAAFVGEIKKLGDNFRPAFFLQKLGRLEDGAIPFDEAVAPADFAPVREKRVSESAFFGQEISESRQGLHD